MNLKKRNSHFRSWLYTIQEYRKVVLRKKMWGIAFVILCVSSFSTITPGEAVAEERDGLLERLERLEEVIRQQEDQLKSNREVLMELKTRLEEQQIATQKVLVATEAKPMAKGQSTKDLVREVLEEIRIESYEQTPEEKRLQTIYDDGFFLRGKDDTLKIGGWYQFDGRFYLDSDHPSANTFTNRRVRFDVRGTLEDYWAYRIYATFVGDPVIQEAWLEYRQFPFARLKIGQFKEPFSLESQYSARWIDFVERSIGVTTMQPAEDIGVMLSGNFWDNRAVYGVGFFNGQGRNGNAVVDDKDVTGRIAVQPFRADKDSLLEKLYVGGSFGFGHNERALGSRDVKTAGQTSFVDFVADAQSDDDLVRYDLELEWLLGPFDFTTEFISTDFDKVQSGSTEEDLTMNSWYATVSYVLTGEDAMRNKPIRPKEKFDLKQGGLGAWQLLGRYERFWLDDKDVIDQGIASGTDGADVYTIGLTWWPNFHLKFMLNYVYTDFDEEITVSNQTMNDENIVLMRGQLNF